MCPDHQLLSVYLDQEMLSPWKEKMETHLRDCPACQARLEQYRKVSAALRANPQEIPGYEPGEERRNRVWRNILQGNGGKYRSRRFWNRSVAVPIPALVAAAAFLALVFTFTLMRINQPVPPPQDSAITNLGPNLQAIVPVSDLEEVFRYLGKDEGSDFVIIQLPESKSFMSSGKPTIIKAADYSRSTESR